MNEDLVLEFGKKYRVGNFQVLKFNKVLRRSEVSELRNQLGIPQDIRKQLQRSQLPYIKVMAVSGIWAVEFCCNTTMYMFIDHVLAKAIKAAESGVHLEHNSVADFAHFFSMFYTDTCVLGDSVYTSDKGNALKAFIERQKAVTGEKETAEEKAADDKVLEELKKDEEAKATIISMANDIQKKEDKE